MEPIGLGLVEPRDRWARVGNEGAAGRTSDGRVHNDLAR